MKTITRKSVSYEDTYIREVRATYHMTETLPFIIQGPDHVAQFVRSILTDNSREHFVALYLDAKHKVTHAHVVSVGTASSTLVHPREVFKAALLANATALITGHNHPSGDVTPSSEDHEVTERLREAGELLGITLLDALVVGPGRRFFASTTGTTRDLQ